MDKKGAIMSMCLISANLGGLDFGPQHDATIVFGLWHTRAPFSLLSGSSTSSMKHKVDRYSSEFT